MPDTLTPGCNPWTTTASPSDLWRVQGVTQRRITEEVALRRTEQGDVRIVLRGDIDPWSRVTGPPLGGWTVVGSDVRWTEESCERITEAGELRIIESGATVSLAALRHLEDGVERHLEGGDIRTLEGFS